MVVDWTFIWLMVVLKLPVLALLGIVWWAVHATPEPEAGDDDDGGTKLPNEPHPGRGPGRGPRPRGPHGETQPPSPPRSRPLRVRSPARSGTGRAS